MKINHHLKIHPTDKSVGFLLTKNRNESPGEQEVNNSMKKIRKLRNKATKNLRRDLK